MLPVAVIAAAAVSAPPPAQPPLSAEVAVCRVAHAPARRRATFRVSAPVPARADRVAVRVDLQQRTARRGRWTTLRAGTFGRWVVSEPGRPALLITKHVVGLAAPAAYRVRVRARWLDRSGRVVARARRATRPCRMPDMRADLVVVALRAEAPGEDGMARYVVRVRNAGRGRAGAFAVTVRPPRASEAASARVPGLGGRREREVALPAIACAPGEVVQVMVDSELEVDEAAEDNVLVAACPLA